uniref:Fe2OG dioxygenase domain-containing protein n=1 Tax=Daphnia magna TaxID=35525 RepID=A0A0P6GTG8_9CRUS
MVDKNRLVAALLLKNDSSAHHCSWGQQLDKEVLHSIEIPELGNLHVPLAIEDVEKLKSIAEPALHGNGLNVVLDPNLRKGWQVAGMRISGLFPKDSLQKTLGELCAKALLNLKLGWLLEDCDSNTVDAYIDKLVLYESGGHYKRHRHSELEQGICGVVILQIPVENGFNGGRLKIEHGSSTAHYEYHEGSNHCHFLTAFRSGCKHELEPIKSGWRVTLMINLVWRNAFDVAKIPQSVQLIPVILELLTEIRESVDPWFKRIHQTKHGKPVIEKTDCCDILHASEISSDVVEQFSELVNKTQISYNAEAASHHRHEEFNNDLSFSPPFELKITNIARFHQRNLEWQQSADFDDGERKPCDSHGQHQKESIDMLVFLLENDYTLTDLTFFGLKGQDVWLARLLLGGNFLEVHLAILNHSRSQVPFGENPSFVAKLEHWVNSSNMLVPFKNVQINANQIVSDFKTKSQHRTHQEEIEEKNMNFPQFAYHQPVLVIWPKYQSFRIKCLYAFDVLLDELEHELQITSHQKAIENLRRIISVCRDEPLTVFLDSAGVPGERTCRLLRLCIFLRARQEGLDLLELMGMDFTNEDECEIDKEVRFEGIRSNEVALLVAELECQVTGWSACSGFVLKMISPVRLSSQLAYIICLADHLMDRYCSEGALKILDRVAYLLPKLNTSSISSLGQTDIDSYVNFVIECERDPKTASAQRVVCFTTLFPRLDSYQQCRLIVDLRRRIRFGGIHSCMQLYQQMCRALPSCDLHAPGPIKDVIVAVVSSFFQLGDPELILLLMNKICLKSTSSNQSAEENNLVDVLLLSHEIWELATSSDLGKTMLSNLVKAQTSSLLCMLDQLTIPRQEIVSAWHIRETELVVPNFKAKTSLLDNLSQLELTSDHSKLIRDARLALIVAWIDGLCQQLDRETPVVTPHPNDPLQLNVTEFLRTFIQMEKVHHQDGRQPISVDFSRLFSKMCLTRLCKLILDLRQTESAASIDMRVIASCFNLCRDLSRQFVEGDIISFMKPSTELAVKIAKWLFWLGDEVVSERFAHKICTCVSLEEENLFVKEMISSSKLWSLTNSAPASLVAFHILLDRHIGYLKTVKEPVFSFEQPLAELPTYPEVEAFLRSSNEKMSYHKLASIFHARGFADDLTKLCLNNGWCSLKARAMGSTRSAWCEIIKTQDMHHANMQQFQAVQQELSKMLSLRENLGHKTLGGKGDAEKMSDFNTSNNCILFSSGKCEKKEPEIIVISD